MNIPNTLTLARIVLVPLVVWLIVTHEMTAAFVLFLLAGFSDAADGYLAKRFQWRTELGAYLDPIADKLLLMSIYVTLGFSNHLPAWLVIAVVSRDILIIGAVPVVMGAVAAGADPSAAREQVEYLRPDRARGPRACRAWPWARPRTARAVPHPGHRRAHHPLRRAPISGAGSGIWRATSLAPLRWPRAKANRYRHSKARSSRGPGLRDDRAAQPRPAASRGSRRGRLPGQRVQSRRGPPDRYLASVEGERKAHHRACGERQDPSCPGVAGALGRRSAVSNRCRYRLARRDGRGDSPHRRRHRSRRL